MGKPGECSGGDGAFGPVMREDGIRVVVCPDCAYSAPTAEPNIDRVPPHRPWVRYYDWSKMLWARKEIQ